MIKVLDNFIPTNRQNDLEQFIMSEFFRWYWNKTTIYNENKRKKWKTKNTIDTGQFVSDILGVRTDKQITDYAKELYKGMKTIFKNINFDDTIRVKSNLNTNKTGYKKTSHQPIHNDIDNKSKKKSIIYYVNDSDGDTIFFDDKLKETKRVKPKKGRAIIFDSHILHCGCNPIKNDKRIVISFVVKNENSILYR